MFSSACFILWFYHYSYKSSPLLFSFFLSLFFLSFFPLNLSSSWHSRVDSLFTTKELKKFGSWLVLYFWPHTVALFMTTLLQSCFCHFQNSVFNKILTGSRVQNLLYVYSVIPFLSVGSVVPLWFGCPLTLSSLKSPSSDLQWERQCHQAVTCSENANVADQWLGSAELLNLLSLLWMKPHMVANLVKWQKQDQLSFGFEISLSLFNFYCIFNIFPTCRYG